ncbi:MFS general substrate transporter [Bimuria novae-zelandiae CBS 107.79]|uniref:MFS general substrate transporter n=1 Tax=Bimuria novae-zelandiae CBS 107.79 TaxID=1447943 RepID=A0A6A5VXY8_9PLEO|nr:MFS general substrate transporter [Bimuria novae-zelandiae CBS 107.79]
MDHNKSGAEHIDAMKSATSSDQNILLKHANNANEEIVQHLQTTREESIVMCHNTYLFTLLMPPAILTFINADLGPDPRYTRITISWNLGGAMFVTIGGRLSDIFGRRYFFIAGACLLIVGSIVSATGQSINRMIAGGAIFGAGSGFLEMSFGAVQEIVPSKYSHVTIDLFDASSIIAQVMPLISWRICYYVMIAFQPLNLVMLCFFYHPPAFKLGGSLYPWVSATTLAPLIIGLLTLAGIVVYENYTTLQESLYPPRLFRAKRHFTTPMVVMAIGGMQYYSNTTLWQRLSRLLYAGDEVFKGLFASVLPLGTIIGGIIVAFSKYIGHQRWQVLFAVALQTACVGTMSTATIDNSAQSIVLTCIISVTTSVNLLNGMILVGFGIVYQEDIGTAAGLAGTSRLLAGAVATAIFSNVTNNKYGSSLSVAVLSNVSRYNLPTDALTKLVAAARANTAAAYQAVPGITPAIRAAATLGNKQAYLEGAHLSYQVALAFGLLGVICAFFYSECG